MGEPYKKFEDNVKIGEIAHLILALLWFDYLGLQFKDAVFGYSGSQYQHGL